jgi:hypothetical protein
MFERLQGRAAGDDMARRIIAIIAFAGFAASLFIHVTYLFRVDADIRAPWFLILFLPVFPLLVLLTYCVPPRGIKGFASLDSITVSAPPWTKRVFLTLFVYVLINGFILLIISWSGSPAVRDHKLVLESRRTVVRELTRNEYAWRTACYIRFTTGCCILFYLGPAVYFWYPPRIANG